MKRMKFRHTSRSHQVQTSGILGWNGALRLFSTQCNGCTQEHTSEQQILLVCSHAYCSVRPRMLCRGNLNMRCRPEPARACQQSTAFCDSTRLDMCTSALFALASQTTNATYELSTFHA